MKIVKRIRDWFTRPSWEMFNREQKSRERSRARGLEMREEIDLHSSLNGKLLFDLRMHREEIRDLKQKLYDSEAATSFFYDRKEAFIKMSAARNNELEAVILDLIQATNFGERHWQQPGCSDECAVENRELLARAKRLLGL